MCVADVKDSQFLERTGLLDVGERRLELLNLDIDFLLHRLR